MAAVIVAYMRAKKASEEREASKERDKADQDGESPTEILGEREPIPKQALVRGPLMERLLLQMRLEYGIFLLLLWFLTFIFMYHFVYDYSKSNSMLGVHTLLVNHFELDTLDSVINIKSLWDFVSLFSAKARELSLDGDPYFPDTQQMRLVKDVTSFSKPLKVPSDVDPKLTTTFSFAAWVKAADREETSGYILRKYIDNQDTSCWAWKYPGQFRYGTHDFGLLHQPREHVVAAPGLSPEEIFTFEAVVVNGTHIQHYRNAVLEHVAEVPRDVTDCVGTMAIGDAGLTIADLRVYPKALAINELEEILDFGSTYEDLFTSTVPFDPLPSETDELKQSMNIAIDKLQSNVLSEFTEMKLRGLRVQVLEEAHETASAAQSSSTTAAGLSYGLSLRCKVGSPCRVQVASAETDIIEEGQTGEVGLVETDLANPCHWSHGLPMDYTYTNAPACSNGHDCIEQLKANGSWSIGHHAFEIGFPQETMSGRTYQLCWRGRLDIAVWEHVGSLTIDPFNDHFLIQPNARIGNSFATFPRPIYHTRTTNTSANFSVAFWVSIKHDPDATHAEYARPMARATDGVDHYGVVCWTVRVYQNKVVYEGGSHTPEGTETAECHIPSIYQLQSSEWRHVALVWTEPDTLIMYLDGNKLCDFHHLHHKNVELNCPNPHDFFMTLDSGEWLAHHDHLPTKGAFELGADVYENLFYPTTALSPAEVKELANTGGYKACHAPEERTDKLYSDASGNGCEWYALQIMLDKAKASEICDSEASAKCALACGTANLCFPGEGLGTVTKTEGKKYIKEVGIDTEKPTILWDRVRKLEEHVLCPSSTADDEDTLIQKCAQGHRAHGPSKWEDINKAGQTNQAPNITDCDVLHHWYQKECTFDGKKTKKWAEKVSETQEFTISFWAKGPYFLHFMNQIYPPIGLASLTLGDDHEFSVQTLTNSNGDLTCDGASNFVTQGHTAGRESPDKWEYYAFQVYNDTEEGISARMFVGGSIVEGEWPLTRFCLGDLQGIMFGSSSGSLISPISLYTHAISQSELYVHYYAEIAMYREYTPGPRRLDSRQFAKIVRERVPYPFWSFLVAPPLAFTTRSESKDCSGHSRHVIETLAEKADHKCQGRYSCDVDYHEFPNELYSCRDEGNSPPSFQGRFPLQLAYEIGYADPPGLFDNPLVLRAGNVINPRQFVDLYTQKLTLSASFVTPKWPGGMEDTITMLIITIDTTFGIKATYKIEHLEIVSSTEVESKIALFVLTLVTLIIIVLIACWFIYTRSKSDNRYRATPSYGISCFDIVLAGFTILVVVLKFIEIKNADYDVGHHVDNLSDIDWRPSNISFSSKITTFFGATNGLLELSIYHDELLKLIGILFFFIVVRLVIAMGVHPRVSLVTGTVLNSGQDLIHFIFCFLVIFVSLGAIATLLFGPSREHFSSLTGTLMNNWENMIGGSIVEGHRDDWALNLYAIIFIVMAFLFLLNFLLAIIVEAYMKVKESIEKQDTEMDLVSDCIALVVLRLFRWRYHWPSDSKICQAIGEMDDDETLITYHDVDHVFETERAWDTFYHYYSAFHWATPKEMCPQKSSNDHKKRYASEAKLNISRKVQQVVPQPDIELSDVSEPNPTQEHAISVGVGR